ncbi:MAG: hypothetical protein WD135_09935, partial [Ferruginibacter sp.]
MFIKSLFKIFISKGLYLMSSRSIIWLPTVRTKLLQFRSERFTPEETFDFIFQVVLEAEEMVKNPVLGRTYIEEFGDNRGMSRIVIRKF